IGAEVIERLVERTRSVGRVASCAAAVDPVGGGQAGIVGPEAAAGVAERSGPTLARGLGQPELRAVVVTDSLGVGWACGAGAEQRATGVERPSRNAVRLTKGGQEGGIAVDGLVHTLARIDDGIGLAPVRVRQ